ncbi:MAG: U32 family peptidase C-terminal domain-containing protein, partial [Cyanobacteria bacterium]|nr:U32 family peptidase C-terminal domain-containing protein [Cyanobacteriota bacterium]
MAQLSSHLSQRPELLLPAGDPEKLKYAIAYGADAVYLGLPMASLRTPTRGQQFTPDNLPNHIHTTQKAGVKAYVTINIFPSNKDLGRIIPHLEQLESVKPDAIIFSDPGVYNLAKQYAPSIPLHLSTQANTLNYAACAFWQDLGVSRVILAREVPLREIREIHEKLPQLELECFIHGSLCVAYSGRCVISDYLTDNTKNSNKGMCGNSCRWEFEEANPDLANAPTIPEETPESVSLQMREKSRPHEVYTFEEDDKGSYMLNSKDLCLVQHLAKLKDAGIVSFKAEGRTKSLFYVATVGRIYNQAMDYVEAHGHDAPEELYTQWIYELSQAGNRGFTEGFFNGRPNQEAYNYESSQSQQGSIFIATVDTEMTAQGKPILDGHKLKIKARNPFQCGDEIEFLGPRANTTAPHANTIHELWDHQGLPCQSLQTNQVG